MPDDTTPHPTPRQLTDYGLGKIADAELQRIDDHLAGCPQCRQKLEAQADDSFVRKLRDTGPGAGMYTAPHQASASVIAAGATPPPADAPAELLASSKYRVLGKLGQGGMGSVFKAVQVAMDRVVAVKVMSPELVSDPEALRRFQQEVKAAARLQHPNIVAAHDADCAGNAHFLVMEYVDGMDLKRLVEKQGPLRIYQACNLVRQAALGLQHAHEKGMVHRDIKPHNLMVNRKGQVKVLDMGLARLARERGGAATLANTFMGTPEYVSPEQATDAGKADIRSDVYSLGCTLFYLLTGQPPFHKEGMLETVLAHIEEPPPEVASLRPDVPPELAELVARMLAKAPQDRPQTPGEVARALLPLTAKQKDGDSGPLPVPPPLPTGIETTEETVPASTTGKRRRRWPWLVGGAAVVGAALLAGWLTLTAKPNASVVTAPEQSKEEKPPGPKEMRFRAIATPREGGNWRVEGDEVVQDTRAFGTTLAFGDTEWTDYDFQVRAMMFGNDGFAMLFRGNSGTYHTFNVGGAMNRNFALDAWRDGKLLAPPLGAAPLKKWPFVAKGLQRNRWYKAEVRVRGKHIVCLLDGRTIFESHGAIQQKGRVGLRTWASTYRFKDIRVTDPTGTKVLLSGLPEL